MEVLEVITSMISNFGFPIACVVAMFCMWDKERSAHAEEAEKWVSALNNNTKVMEQILEVVKKS